MHCYERPTVGLELDVTISRDAQRWEWTPCTTIDPVEEYAYTPEEICRLLRVYGEMGSTRLMPTSYPRFRVLCKGLFTGRLLGTYEWTWKASLGRYRPSGDVWVSVPPMSEWPEEARRGYEAQHGRTPPPCRSCPMR